MREKIPLYVNGRLSEEEARDLEEFIQQYPEITEEMDDFAEIREYLKDTGDIELPDQERLFQRVMQRVHEEEFPLHQERMSLFDKIRDLFSAPLVPWAVAAVQLLLIVFLVTAPYRNNEYRTLTSPVTRTEIMLNIVFNPDAREVDIRGLLNSIGATIVSGPDENGLYIIKVKGNTVEDILETLRNSGLIRFAERRI